jgi:hypothetical protein
MRNNATETVLSALYGLPVKGQMYCRCLYRRGAYLVGGLQPLCEVIPFLFAEEPLELLSVFDGALFLAFVLSWRAFALGQELVGVLEDPRRPYPFFPCPRGLAVQDVFVKPVNLTATVYGDVMVEPVLVFREVSV